ncbi:MAG: PucR family transcriptional regulator ligand-binding domain-containing protein [Sedimentibacter sp.]|uniref:PucR family transcriptional regulator n=1 Tax=Sedimentibacter sp. TaxID=1960295 RepID=UPI0031592503
MNINKIINEIKSGSSVNEQECFVTVEEALRLPMFGGYEILGGKNGLTNKCKHMTILETPEGISWLKGGEFLVTAGYALYGKEDLKQNMIADAYNKGVSAIAIKDMRYFGDISDKLISDSNKYKIPIIRIPYNVTYSEMISNFYYILFYRRNEHILNLNNIYKSLLKLSFEDKEIDEIIHSLSNLTNSNVFLFDNRLELISRSIINIEWYNKVAEQYPFNKSGGSASAEFETFCVNKKFKDSYISIYPIIKRNNKTAFIYVVNENKIDALIQSAIDYGVSIISSKIEKDKLEKFNQPKYKTTMVDIMLNNKDLPLDFYLNFERDIGWDKDGEVVGLCVKTEAVSEKSQDDFSSTVHKVLMESIGHENYLSTEKANDIFVFMKMEPGDFIQDVIAGIYDRLMAYKTKFMVSVGVSKPYESLHDIENLYNESYLAVLFSSFDVVHYSSLDTIRLLYPLKNDDEIVKYFNKTIKKLELYDIKHETNLVDTLEAYFRYNLNNKLTASKLFIHIETLRYRLNRIQEITGFSPNETEGIFALQMGLKLMKLIRLK